MIAPNFKKEEPRSTFEFKKSNQNWLFNYLLKKSSFFVSAAISIPNKIVSQFRTIFSEQFSDWQVQVHFHSYDAYRFVCFKLAYFPTTWECMHWNCSVHFSTILFEIFDVKSVISSVPPIHPNPQSLWNERPNRWQ